MPFLKRLPILNEVLTEVESKYKDLNDFEKIEKMINIIDEEQDDFRASMLLSQIQHYLAIAFSKFQIEFNKCDIKDWVWTEWFDRNKKDIIFCHSFNYDLILESILEYCNVNFRRIGVKSEKEGSSYDKMFVDQNKHRKEEPSLNNIIQHFEEKIIRELGKILDLLYFFDNIFKHCYNNECLKWL